MPGAALIGLVLSCIALWSRTLPLSPTRAWLLLAALAAGGMAVAAGVRYAGQHVGQGATAMAARFRVRRWTVLALLAGLPAVATLVATANGLEDRLAGTATGDHLLSGSICDFPRARPGSWQFVLEVDQAAAGAGGGARPPARILVHWYEGKGRPGVMPQPGQRWQLQLRLRPPRGLVNPGGFDYEQWLFSQGIGATGWVRPDAGNGRLSGAVSCRLAGVRADLARRISRAVGDRPAAAYVLGLSIGAYQALPDEEWEKLRRTGTIHLISISGFHIALLAAPAALLGWAIGGALLALGWRGRPRVIAGGVAFLAALAYGGLAGFSVPTARSVIAVALAAMLASQRRAISGTGLLATVLVVVLLIEPLAPLTPGFWLSFAGVMVLMVVGMHASKPASSPASTPASIPAGTAGGMHGGSQRAWHRAWHLACHHASSLLLTQLCMTIALAPLTILWFGQLPMAGALANLVAIPTFSLVLLPLTLLGTVMVVVAPAAGALVLGRAADGFDRWRQFVDWCAGLPGAVWHFPAPGNLAVMLSLAGVVLLLWPRPWPVRWLAPLLLSGMLAPAVDPVPDGGLRVTVLDVGQGLAVLVQTAGHALLYDSGPSYRAGDAGERVVVPALQAVGVRQLDALMISHADADHRGGAPSVFGRYPSAALLGTDVQARRALPCRAGDRWRWDGVRFDVLHPQAVTPGDADNATSCVLRIATGKAHVLLTGDIEAAAELALLARGGPGVVDLVLAPHHGSRSSSTEAFVQATQPRYVVFSTGHLNRWHFPSAVVMRRWQDTGACLLDTAEHGSLKFDASPVGDLELTAIRRRDSPGIWLARPAHRCIVAPDRSG